jgi:hypothetical protein
MPNRPVPPLRRRAPALATAAAAVVLGLAACAGPPAVRVAAAHPASSTAPSATTTTPATTTPPAPPPLPGGGTQWFPGHRIVAYYGTPGTASLGVLGAAPPDASADAVTKVAAGYATPGTVPVPAFELIATVADRGPGPDGSYSHPISTAVVQQYLQVARAHHVQLILDVQPGRADFLSRVQHWSDLLAQPDVGLALDSEWRMGPDQIPGHSIGRVDATEINAVTGWLADLVRTDHLPQKLVVLHQFTASMITDPQAVAAHPELALVQHLDGFGTRAAKLAKYPALLRPAQFAPGFKLFYQQDIGLMPPAAVLALNPTPAFVSYE